MKESARCLACGCVYPAELEMCPNRYLSPHTEEFVAKVARRYLQTMRTPENHQAVKEFSR